MLLDGTWKWVDGVGDAVKVSGMQVKEGGQGREEERLAGHRRGEQEDCTKECEGAAAEFRDREKWRRAIESEIGRTKG